MHERLVEALAKTRPAAVAIERVFLGRNPDSAFKLGHVRGICLLAASGARAEIFEYAARAVKKGITGNGGASKEQVQLILFAMLGIRVIPLCAGAGAGAGAGAEAPLAGSRLELSVDASDALALAAHHARVCEVDASLRRQAIGREA
jgi:Holliday junction resolvasome RuvABC endonuclease subunit